MVGDLTGTQDKVSGKQSYFLDGGVSEVLVFGKMICDDKIMPFMNDKNLNHEGRRPFVSIYASEKASLHRHFCVTCTARRALL